MNDICPQPIRSTLSCDPDFVDLVQEFVNGIPKKIDLIENSLRDRKLVDLQRHIHRLRGACGGYGFQIMTEAAADIEERLKSGETLESLASDIRQFMNLLTRASV